MSQLPGLVTTTYTVVCDARGVFKRQSSTEQVTRKPPPPPDELSFQALLSNIIKVTAGRKSEATTLEEVAKRPFSSAAQVDRPRYLKSASVDLHLSAPKKEEKVDKRTPAKLSTVIQECNEVQESLMPIWQRASTAVSSKRKELGATRQVLQAVTDDMNVWRSNAHYRSGREALDRRLQDQESQRDREDRALLSHLLGIQSQPSSPVRSDLTSIRSLRFAQKLRRHKRGFGKGFGESIDLRASAPASPVASPVRTFKVESEEQALLKEIRLYRMMEMKGRDEKLPVYIEKTEAVSPTDLLKPEDAVTDLNRFIFRARGKYHTKSISDLNYKRRLMLESKMERIAPSPDVLQKAIMLMEKEKKSKSLKASRIDNLKYSPFSRLGSRASLPRSSDLDDYSSASPKEQTALDQVVRKSQQKKQIVRNLKLIAKQV